MPTSSNIEEVWVRIDGWRASEVSKIADRLEGADAAEVLAWAVEEFHPAIAVGTGLGVEGMVIIDMLHAMAKRPRVLTVDTGRLPQETHDLIERVRARYGLTIEIYFPDPARLEEIVRAHGPNMFYRSRRLRRLCCHVRKVEPLRRALAGLSAWITGLRRDQSVTRVGIRKVEIDEANGGLVKVNPLADWSDEDVWDYVRRNDVPYNALHDQRFPSIGCVPCTRPVLPGESVRSGRWWWEPPAGRECGLHPSGEERPEALTQ